MEQKFDRNGGVSETMLANPCFLGSKSGHGQNKRQG